MVVVGGGGREGRGWGEGGEASCECFRWATPDLPSRRAREALKTLLLSRGSALLSRSAPPEAEADCPAPR